MFSRGEGELVYILGMTKGTTKTIVTFAWGKVVIGKLFGFYQF